MYLILSMKKYSDTYEEYSFLTDVKVKYSNKGSSNKQFLFRFNVNDCVLFYSHFKYVYHDSTPLFEKQHLNILFLDKIKFSALDSVYIQVQEIFFSISNNILTMRIKKSVFFMCNISRKCNPLGKRFFWRTFPP